LIPACSLTGVVVPRLRAAGEAQVELFLRAFLPLALSALPPGIITRMAAVIIIQRIRFI
jgi:hypothetical protein